MAMATTVPADQVELSILKPTATPDLDALAWRIARECRTIIQGCVREEEWQDYDREFFATIRAGMQRQTTGGGAHGMRVRSENHCTDRLNSVLWLAHARTHFSSAAGLPGAAAFPVFRVGEHSGEIGYNRNFSRKTLGGVGQRIAATE